MLLGIAFFQTAGSVRAQAVNTGNPIQIYGVFQQDLNGDQLPDVTVIDCAFASDRDRVYVFDRAGNMRAGDGWVQMTDFKDDIWIFDAGADGTAQLIIAFAEENGDNVAYLYEDLGGDGQVSYEQQGAEIQVTEAPNWRVKVVANGAWLLPDGRANPNVKIYVDGSILRFYEWYLGSSREWARTNLKTDGEVDWEFEIIDRDLDGEADYQLLRLVSDVPTVFTGVYYSSLLVDKNPQPSLPYAQAVFWPFLVARHAYESYRYFDHPPVIAVDLEKGVIERAGILGYPIERGYHIFSTAPTWQKGQVNAVLWENPMAYYDLAEDQDGWPELLVRVAQPMKLDAVPAMPLTAELAAGRIYLGSE